MRVFLDFEASSLAKKSYPIEVGWAFEDGRTETHLIRPASGWTDWDDEAAAMHGIGRDRLLRDGEPVEAVAGRMIETLTGHELYASAPSWDGKWLSTLLRAAGYPRHTLRLRDSEEAFVAAAAARLGPDAGPEVVVALIGAARADLEAAPAAHRALADAERELAIYRAIQRG